MWHGVVFNCESDTAVRFLRPALERQGLSLVSSFDLRTALAQHGQVLCPCHGTTECGCQFAVWLIYSSLGGPATLTLHGEQVRTTAQVVQNPVALPSPQLVKAIMAGLYEAVLNAAGVLVEEEASHDTH